MNDSEISNYVANNIIEELLIDEEIDDEVQEGLSNESDGHYFQPDSRANSSLGLIDEEQRREAVESSSAAAAVRHGQSDADGSADEEARDREEGEEEKVLYKPAAHQKGVQTANDYLSESKRQNKKKGGKL